MLVLDGSLGIISPSSVANSIVLSGSTSGNVTVIANSISINTAVILPLTTGTIPSRLFFRANSNIVSSSTTSTQNVFNVGVTLQANTVYYFEGVYAFSKTVSTTAHALRLGFGGSATVYNILYQTSTINESGSIPLVDTTDESAIIGTTALTTAKSTFGAASLVASIFFHGTVSVNTSGTFIPQFSTSAAVGPYTLSAGSYIKFSAIGPAGANTSIGLWA